MDFRQQFFIVFVFVTCSSVQSKEMCGNLDCLRKTAHTLFQLLVAGGEGLTEPLDPLHLDKIEGEVENVKYKLTNVTLSGLKSCKVTRFILNKKESSYEDDLICSKLIINYNYEAQENLDHTEKGLGSVTAYDYEIILKGKNAKHTFGKDPVPHYLIVSHYIETFPKGKVTIETKNYDADKSKFDQVLTNINQNQNEMDEKYLRSPIMEKFMAIVMKNVDIFIKTKRPAELFPKED